MFVYAVQENNTYAGFSLTNDLALPEADFTGTPLTVVVMGEADDDTARNLVDYFTNLNGPGSYNGAEYYNLTDSSKYTLTAEGQAFLDSRG